MSKTSLPSYYQSAFHPEGALANHTFLVTGGAGFIGSNLVEYLMGHGAAEVRVLDNFFSGKRENLTPYMQAQNFKLIEGDIRNPEVCAEAINGVDYILHQAAIGSVPRSIAYPEPSFDANVHGFVQVFLAAQTAGVKRIVYASSSSVYGDNPTLPKVEAGRGNPLSPYALTKAMNEDWADMMARVYGLSSVGLRYFNIFGPRQDPNGAYAAVIPKFIASYKKGESPIINGDGSFSRDFTFVANAVQANIKALFAPLNKLHDVFNVAAGAQTSLNELCATLEEYLQTPIRPTYGPERKGDIPHSLADVSKATETIGYKPTVTVKDGLGLTIPSVE